MVAFLWVKRVGIGGRVEGLEGWGGILVGNVGWGMGAEDRGGIW